MANTQTDTLGKRTQDWLEFLIRRGVVKLTEGRVFVWTEKGADYMAAQKHNYDFNPIRDPNQTTPAVYAGKMAEMLDIDTVIGLAGGEAIETIN